MWPLVLGQLEAFEMPGKAIWRLQNATNHWGGAGGAYSVPQAP